MACCLARHFIGMRHRPMLVEYAGNFYGLLRWFNCS
jgi:hypothetical protein